MKIADITYYVYSMNKEQTEILEDFYYEDEESALDMAYRLKKYCPKVFIRKEYTYEFEEL